MKVSRAQGSAFINVLFVDLLLLSPMRQSESVSSAFIQMGADRCRIIRHNPSVQSLGI